ncbi:hydroxylaminobenzene mutase [Bradyrhizobium sp. USDA 4518]
MVATPGTLCFTGVLLFLIGLLLGFGIPAFASPRLGLSAHVTAMQSGIALIAVGLLWPQLRFWSGWSVPTAHLLWVSLYVVSVGMTLSAAWATGRTLPIAGGGVAAQHWQEIVVQALLMIGSIGTTAAIASILIQWTWVGS